MRPLLLITVALLAAACTDAPTELLAVDPGVAASIDQAPPESGIVVRGERTWVRTLVDPNSGLRSVVGVPVKEFCQGNFDFDVVSIQRAFLPNPAGNKVALLMGDVHAEVWPAGPFSCAVFLAGDPIASGTAHFVATDNDYAVAGSRTNAFGWHAQGRLGDYRYSEVVRFLLPDGAADAEIKTLKIQLNRVGGPN